LESPLAYVNTDAVEPYCGFGRFFLCLSGASLPVPKVNANAEHFATFLVYNRRKVDILGLYADEQLIWQ
jgi:hypothetical protein